MRKPPAGLRQTGLPGVYSAAPEPAPGTQQPAVVLAGWLGHLLRRELPPHLERLAALLAGLNARVTAWDIGQLGPALGRLGEQVEALELGAIQRRGWLGAAAKTRAARQGVADALEAMAAALTATDVIARPLLAAQAVAFADTRRSAVDISWERQELQRLLDRGRPWLESLWVDLRRARPDAPGEARDFARRVLAAADQAGKLLDAVAGVVRRLEPVELQVALLIELRQRLMAVATEALPPQARIVRSRMANLMRPPDQLATGPLHSLQDVTHEQMKLVSVVAHAQALVEAVQAHERTVGQALVQLRDQLELLQRATV